MYLTANIVIEPYTRLINAAGMTKTSGLENSRPGPGSTADMTACHSGWPQCRHRGGR